MLVLFLLPVFQEDLLLGLLRVRIVDALPLQVRYLLLFLSLPPFEVIFGRVFVVLDVGIQLAYLVEYLIVKVLGEQQFLAGWHFLGVIAFVDPSIFVLDLPDDDAPVFAHREEPLVVLGEPHALDWACVPLLLEEFSHATAGVKGELLGAHCAWPALLLALSLALRQSRNEHFAATADQDRADVQLGVEFQVRVFPVDDLHDFLVVADHLDCIQVAFF